MKRAAASLQRRHHSVSDQPVENANGLTRLAGDEPFNNLAKKETGTMP